MNTKNKLAIHFDELSPKEIALFERVISFNVTHGLEANIENDASISDLIVTTSESFSSVENNNARFVVITNDDTNTQGDLQLNRPLMITKVMGALTDAINLVNEKQESKQGHWQEQAKIHDQEQGRKAQTHIKGQIKA